MGKKINLSDGEWKVMNCLWKHSPQTITQLVNALKEETGWNKHTVITYLTRLETKGAIQYKRGERAKLFYPVIDQNDAALAETQSFVSKVHGGRIGLMLSAMIDNEAISKEEVDELYSILNRAEAEEVK